MAKKKKNKDVEDANELLEELKERLGNLRPPIFFVSTLDNLEDVDGTVTDLAAAVDAEEYFLGQLNEALSEAEHLASMYQDASETTP